VGEVFYIVIWLEFFPLVGYCGDVECYEEFKTYDESQCLEIKFQIYEYWTKRGVKIKKLECES